MPSPGVIPPEGRPGLVAFLTIFNFCGVSETLEYLSFRRGPSKAATSGVSLPPLLNFSAEGYFTRRGRLPLRPEFCLLRPWPVDCEDRDGKAFIFMMWLDWSIPSYTSVNESITYLQFHPEFLEFLLCRHTHNVFII